MLVGKKIVSNSARELEFVFLFVSLPLTIVQICFLPRLYFLVNINGEVLMTTNIDSKTRKITAKACFSNPKEIDGQTHT